jgi:hypothetical protein
MRLDQEGSPLNGVDDREATVPRAFYDTPSTKEIHDNVSDSPII